MDQNNNQTNKNIKKATEKRKNPFDLEVQEDVVQSHVLPYSFEIDKMNFGNKIKITFKRCQVTK